MDLDISIRISGIIEAFGSRYRVFYVSPSEIGMCKLDTTKTEVTYVATDVCIANLEKDWTIQYEEDLSVVEEGNLSEAQRRYYMKRRQAIDEIAAAYGPSYRDFFTSGVAKEEYKDICKKYGLSRNQARTMILRYIQSGLKYSSLLPKEKVVRNISETRLRAGRKGILANDVVINAEIKGYFDEAISEYLSNQGKSLRDVYQEMKARHYTTIEVSEGELRRTLQPMKDIPTFRQFEYYYRKTVTKEDAHIARLGARKVRNDERVLTGTSATGIRSAGDMAELDAKECDVSLVSSFDPSVTIGRPILYIMIDVKTYLILAMSVAFDNNSYTGVTNLFLNLAEDKQEYAARYGIQINDAATWPSGFKPAAIRTDRGSEDISKEFSRLCAELHIEKNTEPPATGSLKGLVEQFFREIDLMTNPYTEGHGRIKKEYGSKHHEEACLTIDAFTKIAISCVLQHNTRTLKDYDMPGEMRASGVDPAPLTLWNHFCREYGQPRVIGDRQQFLWSVMHRGKARLRRDGIHFNNLNYMSNDPDLLKRMFDVGKKSETLEIRFDPRDASFIFYQASDNTVKPLVLNKNKAWEYSCIGKTFKEVDDAWAMGKLKQIEELRRNDELDMWRRDVVQTTVADSIIGITPSKQGMRQLREIEKQAVASERSVASEVAGTLLTAPGEPEEPEIIEIEEIDADDEFDSLI